MSTQENSVNDGGPAFPLAASTGDPRDGVYCTSGMSLRDYFAGQALAGLIASTATDGDDWDTIAAKAYDSAYAMIAAKGGEK